MPSVKAIKEASSPLRHSSTTTILPASPKALSLSMESMASFASSRVEHIITPLPAASPSALTTQGAPRALA